jgi:hypothetical protein
MNIWFRSDQNSTFRTEERIVLQNNPEYIFNTLRSYGTVPYHLKEENNFSRISLKRKNHKTQLP